LSKNNRRLNGSPRQAPQTTKRVILPDLR